MDDSDHETTTALEKDLHCSCCFELMVEPTTLNCGHSFCRICLAQWWYTSKKTTCPDCRQSWPGFPKVNIILRKTITTLFADQLIARTESVEKGPNYNKIIRKFEDFGQKRLAQKQVGFIDFSGFHPQPARGVVTTKRVAIVIAIIGILLFLILFRILFTWDQPLVHKPIGSWSPADVSKWVASLGPWSKEINSQRFQELGINGNILQSMTDSGLEELLGIQKSYLRLSLLSEIEQVKQLGFKAPTEFWEYKALFPTRCIFLLWGFREYPRATIIYSFIFLHREVFLPLFLATSDGQFEISMGELDDEWYPAPRVDVLRFLVKAMLTPYYFIGKFSFQWSHVNFWSVSILIIFCILKTLTELLQSRWLLLGGWKHLPGIVKESTKAVIVNGSFYFLLWNLLPSFISNIIFYWLMFTAPLYACKSLKESYHSTRLNVGPVENTPLELTKSVLLWLWQKITRRFENEQTRFEPDL